ncbi:MAG: Fe-S cluster assembly protein SufD [Prevotellaceae bacterium]|jgi:Fe-S cluster assembly protein SufD|nr:Fe-S cluster assembly protein SufD [Prevotellaceae bacterium]
MNYIKIYEERKVSGAKLLNSYREKSFASIEKKGLPDRNEEKYRYTRLKEIFAAEYQLAVETNTVPESLKNKLKTSIPDLDAHFIYTVNGVAEYPVYETEDGITLCSLSQACELSSETVSKYYNTTVDQDDTTALLNTALASDGIFLKVEARRAVSKTIVIINTVTAHCPSFSQQRNLFVFEANAQARLVIINMNPAGDIVVSNNVSEIIIKKNARIEIANIHDDSEQCSQINSIFGRQEEGSSLDCTTITLGGKLIRNNIEIELAGERCENHLYGLTVAEEKQHIDNYTFVNHAAPACESNELFKSIVGGSAVNVFNGRIFVRQDAQKTSAFQSNRNILLSKDAKIYTKPQLEIYADDVKCSHGATVGRLDDEAILYMQARGIGKNQARLLLTFGFASEIIAKIHIPELREYLADKVNNTLSKFYL